MHRECSARRTVWPYVDIVCGDLAPKAAERESMVTERLLARDEVVSCPLERDVCSASRVGPRWVEERWSSTRYLVRHGIAVVSVWLCCSRSSR
eukprot:7390334-Prymnesium_polylepis.1